MIIFIIKSPILIYFTLYSHHNCHNMVNYAHLHFCCSWNADRVDTQMGVGVHLFILSTQMITSYVTFNHLGLFFAYNILMFSLINLALIS